MEVMNKFPSIRELLSTLNNLGDYPKGIFVLDKEDDERRHGTKVGFETSYPCCRVKRSW